MINRRLTAREAAEQLGVKQATLYSYVSRGLLDRKKTPRGSTFDPHDVARLARSGRQSPSVTADRRTGARTEPAFVTELTLIDGGHLYYRGVDAIVLSRGRSFEEVATWLWTAEWPRAGGSALWTTHPLTRTSIRNALDVLPAGARPVERFIVAVTAAAVSDQLRYDLNAGSIPIIGRSLISGLVEAIGSGPDSGKAAGLGGGSVASRLWPRLSPLRADPGRVALLDAALVLSADHELAPSTMAARVAASFRADPYAVVSTGLGPASGSWSAGSSGAPTEVERLLLDAMQVGAERAIGDRMRETGSVPHGFGMPLYPDGDPRGTELIRRLDEVSGPAERHDVVRRVLDIASDRGFPPPNADLGLGALSFCAEMAPESGHAIATLGKVAGWLAHALEEYANPTRFRSRGYYLGPPPSPGVDIAG